MNYIKIQGGCMGHYDCPGVKGLIIKSLLKNLGWVYFISERDRTLIFIGSSKRQSPRG